MLNLEKNFYAEDGKTIDYIMKYDAIKDLFIKK